MRALKAFLRETEVAYALADRLSDAPLVQGVHAEPHPEMLADWIGWHYRYAEIHRSWPFENRGPFDVPTDPAFDFWGQRDDAKTQLGYDRLPLLIRVHLAPARMQDAPDAAVAEMRNYVDKLCDDFRSRLVIVIEDRAIARAAAAPGDGVSGFDHGTLGGILHDPGDGQYFGFTCAHVAPQGYAVATAAGAALGQIQAASSLSPNPGVTLCRPHAANANRLDAALFDIPPTLVGRASGLSATVAYGSGQRALMKGGKSGGPHSYYFGSLGLTQMIDITMPDAANPGGLQQAYCFHDLATIRPVPTLWRFIGHQHRSLSGDSGAFITDVGGTEWCGVLCATDGTEGFLFDATEALDWARQSSVRPTLKPW